VEARSKTSTALLGEGGVGRLLSGVHVSSGQFLPMDAANSPQWHQRSWRCTRRRFIVDDNPSHDPEDSLEPDQGGAVPRQIVEAMPVQALPEVGSEFLVSFRAVDAT